MEESDKTLNQENTIEKCKIVGVCGFCRHHQHNPTIEFSFPDSKVYYLCQSCKKMNEMDFSKPLPSPYPRTKRM